MKRTITLFIISICLALAVVPGCLKSSDSNNRTDMLNLALASSLLKFSTKTSTYVAMSDGTRLAVDIFIPINLQGKRLPVVFMFTPYGRAYAYLPFGVVFDGSYTASIKNLVVNGYAVVVADMRGTGASFGTQGPFMPVLGIDGRELIEWMAAQDWCDGNVGMMGQSYLGWSQLATAKNKPSALKAIMPEVAPFEGYTSGFRPGGIAAQRWISLYSSYLNFRNLNYNSIPSSMYPSAPVTDDDGDGQLVDEIPVMSTGDPATFLDDVLSYADGATHANSTYYSATKEHTANITFSQMANAMPYIDSSAPSPYSSMSYLDGSPGYFAPAIMEFGIPIYHIGGWFDGFTRDTMKLYATLRLKNPSKIIMAPRFHSPKITDPYRGYLNYQGDYATMIDGERLRFFNRYLKNVDNGIDSESPLKVYVMNDGWRSENEWPLARQVVTPYYLSENGLLSTTPSSDGTDLYSVDFTHASSYGTNLINRWVMMDVPNALMIRTDPDKKCLVYETAALESDTEVTGHPVIRLWVSSNQNSGDFFVYLTDVDAAGRSLYVTEGQLRAEWQNVYPADDQVGNVVHVLPELPWHGYKKSQYTSAPFSGGLIQELNFDLIPTSWLFKKGHKIRVAIAGADAGNFELNPVLSPNNVSSELPSTTITVHRSSSSYTSRIELPIIPR